MKIKSNRERKKQHFEEKSFSFFIQTIAGFAVLINATD